eukprot:1140538_1
MAEHTEESENYEVTFTEVHLGIKWKFGFDSQNNEGAFVSEIYSYFAAQSVITSSQLIQINNEDLNGWKYDKIENHLKSFTETGDIIPLKLTFKISSATLNTWKQQNVSERVGSERNISVHNNKLYDHYGVMFSEIPLGLELIPADNINDATPKTIVRDVQSRIALKNVVPSSYIIQIGDENVSEWTHAKTTEYLESLSKNRVNIPLKLSFKIPSLQWMQWKDQDLTQRAGSKRLISTTNPHHVASTASSIPSIYRCSLSSGSYGSYMYYQQQLTPFHANMTIKQASELKIHDCFDHRDAVGRMVHAQVVDKQGTLLKVHYMGWSRKWDCWCDYSQNIHRFANEKSISTRKRHRLYGLAKYDYVELNPMRRHPGWKLAEIRRMDKQSGQIQCVYQMNETNYLYWSHFDDIHEVRPFTNNCDDANTAREDEKEIQNADEETQTQQQHSIKELVKDLDDEKLDDLLNEIDGNKYEPLPTGNQWEKWNFIKKKMENNDVQYIKHCINTRQIGINERDNLNNTALMVCADFGCYEIAELLCDLGCDIHAECAGITALQHARDHKNYHIASLLLFRKFGASLGAQVKDTVNDINRITGICDYAINQMSKEHMDANIAFISDCIKKRAPFSDDMLNICMTYIKKRDGAKNVMKSELFETIMSCFNDIIKDTSDKLGFEWLNAFLVPSAIWFWEHPLEQGKLLFEELIIKVQEESKKQAKNWLSDEIAKMKTDEQTWDALIGYGDDDDITAIPRQDALNKGLKAARPKLDFIRDKTIGFDPIQHYNSNIYLNQLLLMANKVDGEFQTEMDRITNEIKAKNALTAQYRGGPVKTATRSKIKVESEYFCEAFPSAARLLDINRCSLLFTNASDLVIFVRQFKEFIEHKQSKCILNIVRIKNGFRELNEAINTNQNYFYADLKMNVCVLNTKTGGELIGEVQCLLLFMSTYKNNVSHALYGIERRNEFLSNFAMIRHELLDENTQLFTNAAFGNYKNVIHSIVTHHRNALEYVSAENGLIFEMAIKLNHATFIQRMSQILSKNDFEKHLLGGNNLWIAFSRRSMDVLDLICRKWPSLLMEYENTIDGCNALHYICYFGDVFRVIFDWVFERDENDKYGYDTQKKLCFQACLGGANPLQRLCENKHFEMAKRMIESLQDKDRDLILNGSAAQSVQSFKESNDAFRAYIESLPPKKSDIDNSI